MTEKNPHYVLDVNVLLRTVTGRHRSPDTALYRMFVRGECRFLFSEALLREFTRVLNYPEVLSLGMTPALAFGLAIDLMQFGLYLPFVEALDWPSVSDRNDWYLFDLLFASDADALITHDRKLLEAGKELEMPVLHPSKL